MFSKIEKGIYLSSPLTPWGAKRPPLLIIDQLVNFLLWNVSSIQQAFGVRVCSTPRDAQGLQDCSWPMLGSQVVLGNESGYTACMSPISYMFSLSSYYLLSLSTPFCHTALTVYVYSNYIYIRTLISGYRKLLIFDIFSFLSFKFNYFCYYDFRFTDFLCHLTSTLEMF